jgi:catechol 2,3-dioxygenase-like lactoylglutathione lyase family enzyme
MDFNALGLFVDNMEAMVKFYRDIIGLKTDWKKEEPAAEFEAGTCIFVMVGRNDFETIISKSLTYPNGLNGTMVIGLNVKHHKDVDIEYKRLMDLGVESVSPPKTNDWGQRTCYVADPEGNLLEIGSYEAG